MGLTLPFPCLVIISLFFFGDNPFSHWLWFWWDGRSKRPAKRMGCSSPGIWILSHGIQGLTMIGVGSLGRPHGCVPQGSVARFSPCTLPPRCPLLLGLQKPSHADDLKWVILTRPVVSELKVYI